MFKALLILLLTVASGIAGAQAACSDAWYRAIEQQVTAGDGQGHGPDIGTDEWKSAIEFKLGVRGKPAVPPRDSADWCAYIDQVARQRGALSGQAQRDPVTQAPSFDCSKAPPGSIVAMICENEALSALDRKLATVYAAASGKATKEQKMRLKAEQRGWIKGRDECWKSGSQAVDIRDCVEREYRSRIAGLQARYRLVPSRGPFRYACEGNAANEVVATFFQTDPPSLIAERGDSVSLMFLQPSGSGARYQGRNETFREHRGETMITWGPGAPEMRCKQMP